MKLTFIGAAHEVTGSCHLLQVNGKNILLDCGMEQGRDIYENIQIPVPVNQIDAVLLSHAHMDHSGRLPWLTAQGFSGQIITTSATAQLCQIMLRDSAHIQESEAEWKNRKARRAGMPEEPPMYTMMDAEATLKLFVPVEYGQTVEVAEGVTARFEDVGHLLGSASIHLTLTEGNTTKKLIFSGDLGNRNQPLTKNPGTLEPADYVIMESTYGDRLHGAVPDFIPPLTRLMQETFEKGGNLVMMLFSFTMIFNAGMIPNYILMRDLNLLNTRLVMLLPGAISAYNMIIARTFFQTNIPRELLEAAQMDGCSDARFLISVVLPLSKAILAVLMMFYCTVHWNSYFNAFLYLSNDQLYPLQIVLRDILIQAQTAASDVSDAENALEIQGLAESMKYSLMIVSTIPMMVIYPFAQKHFTQGVMIGSIKG